MRLLLAIALAILPIALPAYAPGNGTNRDTPLKYCLVRDYTAWNPIDSRIS